MNRISRQADAEAIADALSFVPVRIQERVGNVDVLTRTDPIFAGLHAFEECGVGSYREIGHAVFPCHQAHRPASERRDTIVLPAPFFTYPIPVVRRMIVHEFAHMLHERLRFEPLVAPVTMYAETNHLEAFAEAFMAWAVGPSCTYTDSGRPIVSTLHERDPQAVALFEALAI